MWSRFVDGNGNMYGGMEGIFGGLEMEMETKTGGGNIPSSSYFPHKPSHSPSCHHVDRVVLKSWDLAPPPLHHPHLPLPHLLSSFLSKAHPWKLHRQLSKALLRWFWTCPSSFSSLLRRWRSLLVLGLPGLWVRSRLRALLFWFAMGERWVEGLGWWGWWQNYVRRWGEIGEARNGGRES